tara:strand:+ start:368 stop:814 length:447 start_codon:yes stop_codon:yes gene_type:complete
LTGLLVSYFNGVFNTKQDNIMIDEVDEVKNKAPRKKASAKKVADKPTEEYLNSPKRVSSDNGRVIAEYTLTVAPKQNVSVPKGYEYVKCEVQGGKPQLWLSIDPNEKDTVELKLEMIATGVIMEKDIKDYLNTLILRNGDLVFHLFRG